MYSTFLEITDKYSFLLVKRINMFQGSLTYELAYQEIEILEIIDHFTTYFYQTILHKYCVGDHLSTKIAWH